MVKKNKTLDEKTASLWLQNTGKKTPENDNTDTVTEQVTDDDLKSKDSNNINQQEKDSGNTLLANNKEKLTERFELKMSPLQIKRLEELADKYNKYKSEVMRTAFNFFVKHLNN